MALTLLEASKKHKGNVIRQSIIEIFANAVELMRVMPFETIPGNAYSYNVEEALPGIAFRGINEAYSESTGVINPVVDPLVIAGGDLDVDKFIVRTMGADQRATHEAMKAKALSHTVSHKFIKGDSTTDPREFDGLQARLVGAQLIAAGATSGGDALSLAKLDELIDAVDDPSHIFCSKAIRRLLTAAARNTAVGGFISYDKDEFGNKLTMYNGIPLIIADPNDSAFATLGFNEANPGGGSAVGTSIYVVSLREGMLTGLQNGDMDVNDLGELETKPVFRTRVEWYVGMALMHPRAAARLWGIKNAAVVV